MSLTDTPNANRLHIALFGRRNSGKSSLINALTGQDSDEEDLESRIYQRTTNRSRDLGSRIADEPLSPSRNGFIAYLNSLHNLTAGCANALAESQALSQYFDFYNRRRPHSTLDGNTPDTAYFNLSKPPLAAAA